MGNGWALRTLRAACIGLAAWAASAQGSPRELNARARCLAGLAPEAGAGWDKILSEPAWKEHQEAMAKAWKGVEARRVTPMRAFGASELAGPRAQGTLFYPFGGPDLLHARALFPSAKTLVLCGLEPLGELPDLKALTPEARRKALTQLRHSLESSLKLSFFITTRMITDLRSSPAQGVLPIVCAYAALLGDDVTGLELLTLDAQGRPVPAEGKPTGFRLTLRHAGSEAPCTVYYWRQDCSDKRLSPAHPLIAFLKAQGRGVTYLKSASYLMHTKGFMTIRDQILVSSTHVVQDDSGIPHRVFTERKWGIQAYGSYHAPISEFTWAKQKDLVALFEDTKTLRPLPFHTGYGHESNLVCYTAPQNR